MKEQRQKAFEEIYSSHSWGGGSRSGPGSDPEHTAEYVRFVNRWLEKHPDCRNIVELGCGDWATTSRINLGANRTYLGWDIVLGVVAANREKFGTESVRFECGDFISEPPPGADLLLVKDVLQHLSNAAVRDFLKAILPRFHYAIITNDVRKFEETPRLGVLTRRRNLQEPNADIADGKSRPLKLDQPPFALAVEEKATYAVRMRHDGGALVYEKDILVWRNPAARKP